ncbi:unnamed protein product [Musa hybrid cultivar]
MEKDASVLDRLARMKVNYMKQGMQRSVEGILLSYGSVLSMIPLQLSRFKFIMVRRSVKLLGWQ